MSDVVTAAVDALSKKLGDESFDGSAKFVIEGEGSIVIDADGVRASDDDTDVTLTADTETFQSILEGETNPTAAFMTGKLSVDGDMGQAMKLGALLG
ncbi:SCP-2 sterol transfer family protein [Salinihabitans flavidus]|uniref:SCP-2 sterol transfer family protein n=1 Tax=Salinihabitans flavidus TaxID=569882 RepID=A0A1H8T7N4_9RHOB|nr:SCP2 sterol-binding domain-containing protein [Salinihabitans flavidus]SEO86584.1 SCP-2 sterol transfer family protein [Salinihabitans flavidus]